VVAGGGAVLGLILGTLIAYSTHRLQPRGFRSLDVLASLPFGIPGIVIGLGFLWSYVYLPIYGTLWVLVCCYMARFLPYATETIGAQVVQLDRALEDVVPAVTWLLDALEPNDAFLSLEPAQRRQRANRSLDRLP